MSNSLRALIILVAIGAGVLAIVSGTAPAEDPSVADERVGRAAPDFDLALLDSEDRRTLADYAGQVVVLDFWATHCAPCRRSIPHVERLGRNFADRGVKLVSVNVDFPDQRRDQLVRSFVRDQRMEAEVLLDDGAVAYQYGAQRIPLLVMVDRQGVIRRVYRGYHEYGLLAQGLESLL